MNFRFTSLLCSALLFGIHLHAEELAEASPFDPQEHAGEAWRKFEVPFDTDNGQTSTFLQRADTLLLKKGEMMAVNVRRDIVDPDPRPQFDAATSKIAFDGNSPVFWTLPSDPVANQDFSIRDWSTGQIVATLETGSDHPLIGAVRHQLDVRGLVALSTTKLITTDSDGGNLQKVDLPLTIFPTGGVVSATDDWIVAVLHWADSSPSETLVWNRHTLELANRVPGYWYHLSAYGDKVAVAVTDQVRVLSLPGLVSQTIIPKPSGTTAFIQQLHLGSTGLLVRHFEAGNLRHDIRLFELLEPQGNSLKRSFRTPVPPRAVHMSEDTLAITSWEDDIYLWTGRTAVPKLDILAGNSLREGDPVECSIQLSSPADEPVVVELATFDGTAKTGEDYLPFSGQLTIPAGETEASFTIDTIRDKVLEADESFGIRIVSVSGALPTLERASILIRGNGFNLEIAPATFRQSNRRWTTISAYAAGKLLGLSRVFPNPGYQKDATIMTLDGGATDRFLTEASFADTGVDFVHGEIVAWGYKNWVSALNIITGETLANRSTTPGHLIGLTDENHVLIETDESGQDSKLVRQRLSDGAAIAELTLWEGETLRHDSPAALIPPQPLSLPEDSLFLASTLIPASPLEPSTDRLREIDPLTLEVRRTWTWQSNTEEPAGPGRVLAVSGELVFFLNSNELMAFDTTSAKVIWRLAFGTNSNYVTGAVSNGMILVAKADVYSSTASNQLLSILDIRTGRSLRSLSMTDIFAGATSLGTKPAKIFPDADGWVVALGSGACRITSRNLLPNVDMQIGTFYDNQETEALISTREDFQGSYETHWFEFVDDYRRTDINTAEVVPYTKRLDLSSSSQTLSLGSFREVAGNESIRVAVGGPITDYTNAIYPPYPIRILGTTSFVILPHKTANKVWEALATPAPTRRSNVFTIAVSGRYLAAGFPSESLTLGNTTTSDPKVDVYDIAERRFLYTLSGTDLTAASGFGTSLAFSRGRLIIGAPGSTEGNMLDGKVFLFDAADGGLLETITRPFGARAFGTSIAANDDWIAIGAPATYSAFGGLGDRDFASFYNGSIHVYDASDFRKKFSKTQRGEMLGYSLALMDNQLAAGSPLFTSALDETPLAGLVRLYDIPSSSEVAGILPAYPQTEGHFGSKLAASPAGLAIGPITFDELRMTGHGILPSDSEIIWGQGMPNVTESNPALVKVRDVTLSSGKTMRLYHGAKPRPYASFSNPGVTYSTPACDGRHIYSGTTTIMRTDFVLPPLNDSDANGRIDEFDWLIAGNSGSSLPTISVLEPAFSGDPWMMEISSPTGIDSTWDLVLLESPDLLTWNTALRWSAAADGWIDPDGALLPKNAHGNSTFRATTQEHRCFFQFQLQSKN